MTMSSYKGVKLEKDNYFEWHNSVVAYISACGVHGFITHPEGLRPIVETQMATKFSTAKAAALATGGIAMVLVINLATDRP